MVGSNPHASCSHQPAALATMAEEHQQKVEARAKAVGGPSAASSALPGPDSSGVFLGPAEVVAKAPPSKKGDVGHMHRRIAGPLPAELMATDEQDRQYYKTTKKIVKANLHLQSVQTLT